MHSVLSLSKLKLPKSFALPKSSFATTSFILSKFNSNGSNRANQAIEQARKRSRERAAAKANRAFQEARKPSSTVIRATQNIQPEYTPKVLDSNSLIAPILSQGALIITRKVEMLNVFMGFEQANRYAILDLQGNTLGYMLEENSLTSTIMRQATRLHRPFKVTVFDAQYRPALVISRNFSIINSKIRVCNENNEHIGETHQQWHLIRRKYNLFDKHTQFAKIDAPFLSWQFDITDQQNYLLASVSRNFIGLGMELFTDAGQYVLRMDPLLLSIERGGNSYSADLVDFQAEGISSRILTYDERAVLLANAISIDFDYFSRHSHNY
ncbi:hypothetical protein BB561_003791 [Smittium simulii]|uniref:Phospholipid scramblase n=1 Tax=Smittium simulii TaxID=133385 RepID=A0A2T9YJI9_9FUNG|nr:hypothetical protein BB561_003791 [Smittium simulii]